MQMQVTKEALELATHEQWNMLLNRVRAWRWTDVIVVRGGEGLPDGYLFVNGADLSCEPPRTSCLGIAPDGSVSS